MSETETPKQSVKKLPSARRRAVSPAQEGLVTSGYLQPDKPLPLLITPGADPVNLLEWAAGNRDMIEAQLLKHGGILFRGFDVASVADFERFISITAERWAEYREPATPRSQVSGNIYTSTDYPAAQSIFLHNENSHTESWPLKIFFFCATPAQQAGETPIADCRNIFQRLDPAIRERFLQKKVMYVRNFGEGLGFPWQNVFKTGDKAEVEQYCRKNGITAEWKPGDNLRIRYVRQAAAPHPRTGEMVWFNHATFFHVSTLDPAIRAGLLAVMKEEDLPYNTYYGDGSPIEPLVLDELRAAYHQETVAFPWQTGDLLMLDNMLVAHGRAPFVGPRKILVGMADPCRWEDLTASETAQEGAGHGV